VLLAADVGNTEIVLGMFRAGELEQTWRMSTQPERTADELALAWSGFLAQRDLSFATEVTGMAVASVVPDVTATIREMTSQHFPFEPVIVGPGVKTGVPILTDNPREVGPDRVVNTLACFSRFGGPAIVVDFGTSTNFDIVSARGEFLGGIIGPGIQMAAASLFSRTARLTRVELAAPPHVVGKNTVEAIQSALVYGTASMVDGMIERIRGELPAATTVATGGLAPVVIPHCRSVEQHEPWLTLEGLRLVFERNAEAPDE
jgi:type III pantothenate kinase